MAIALRYAARSDVGLVRQNNQDSAYAGPHLLVVADGMGGHAGGDVASSLAIGELAPLDGESHGADDALEHLKQAVFAAHRELLSRVDEEPQLTGMGTTVTALLRTGGKLALAHIGDSRAYVLRDGDLIQITKDHTFVQTLVDEGRLTLEEAEQHPQRSVLMRVLSDVIDDVEPDLSMREGRPGDRYLLCSDGLSGVVSHDTLHDTLAAGADPATTCEALVQLALRAGAPDNVTCIVADVVDATTEPPVTNPAVVGAATLNQRARATVGAPSAAERAAALTAPVPMSVASGDTQPIPLAAMRDEVKLVAEPEKAPRRGLRLVGVLVVLAVVVAGGYTAWRWVQNQYFVGQSAGVVAVFQGLPEDVGPVKLSHVAGTASDIQVADLPEFDRQRVQSGIVANTESQAWKIVDTLSARAAACRASRAAAATPSPTATATPSATVSPSANPTAGSTATAPAASPTKKPGASATSAAPTPSLTETDPVTLPSASAAPTDDAPLGSDCGAATS
ncbi:PP2C family serine/threonine-protein phosphatase [Kineosporia sp. A_224]|uniref:PP2C family protein-serine/threonine phosphatase n=1 Tax=Kineosporia sp. A_224 TaxID=1962180 RepID=UPI000B4B3734|nr:PP2C family serine/threonine-protein phosphatase [Kineosporia sp. A_224]